MGTSAEVLDWKARVLPLAKGGLWLFSFLWFGGALMLTFGSLLFSTTLDSDIAYQAFHYSIAFVIPILAWLGYATGKDWEGFKRGALVLASGAAVTALTGAVAGSLHPSYPVEGPHPLFATLYAVCGVVAATGALWCVAHESRLEKLLFTLGAVLTFAIFTFIYSTYSQPLEALPLSVDRIVRWKESDIQDYDRYFVRAYGISKEQAEDYAHRLGLEPHDGPMTCAPWRDNAAFEPAPEGSLLWMEDFRTKEKDTFRYPAGTSGCYTQAAFNDEILYACYVCDWGI